MDESLPTLFGSAKTKYDSLEHLDPRSVKAIIQDTLQELQRCLTAVDKLSLFSPNEELEDISTKNLQYLTIPYLTAELLLKSYDDQRLAALRRASQALESFLTRLDQYRILSKGDQDLFERYRQERGKFSVISTSSPDEKRKIKISRFQEEKALKQKLQVSRSSSHNRNMV